MKLYKFFTAVGVLALAAGFTSCSDDDEAYTPGFEGVEGQVVLAPTYNESYKIIKIPTGIITPTMSWSVAPRSRVRAGEELKTKFEIDNSLISAYNAENETDCIALPEGIATLENAEPVITVGNTSSEVPVTIKFTDNQQLLDQLDLDATYILPVRMTAVTQGSARIAVSASNISYVTFNLEEVLLNNGGTPTGSRLDASARSGWSMTPFGDYGVYSGSASDPINSTGRYWYLALQEGGVTIDLGKEYKFDGIFCNSSFGSRYYLLTSGIELTYSNDGNSWSKIGTVDRTTNTVALYAPINARYIQIYSPNYVLTAWTEVSIYEVQ